MGLAALGATLMILSGTGGNTTASNRSADQSAAANKTAPAVAGPDTATEMEQRLQSVLSQVAGAGRVEVEIHLADSGETDYATNVNTDKKSSTQKDAGGATTVTTEDSENDQLVSGSGGDNGSPMVRRKTAPLVDGVLVIAEGASDPVVRADLTEAAAVALHVAPYQVLVLPRGGGQ